MASKQDKERESGTEILDAAAPGPRIDETTPGGQYEVDGRLVDAEGHAL
jgi:hypothetical protein